jgi:cytochrome oxidase Cu insertion factor (SCO1/SenC/PrrC family)
MWTVLLKLITIQQQEVKKHRIILIGFLLPVVNNNKPDSSQNIADQFIHTQLFALVDKQTTVRGIYDGLKEDEMEKLLKDIEGLLKEKHQNRALKGY